MPVAPLAPQEQARRLLRRSDVQPCTCPIEEIPCGCQGPCNCIPRYKDCIHVQRIKARYPEGQGFPMTWEEWVALCEEVNPEPFGKGNVNAYREPPPPKSYTRTLNPARRVRIMARRLARGEHLYHERDWCMEKTDAVGHEGFRRRNGSAGRGEISRRAA
jgi:hypothetical protein